ncbi:MAG: hypothetical protein QOG52_2030 [Frankiaceae bacterium]|nr:hypothetical protein [Frankiaceae bacterium]MDQ1725002.1 hypothetical protein [Frankiaceae bacterium]
MIASVPAMELTGTVASLNVGRIRLAPGLPGSGSAIDKRPVEGRVRAGIEGLDGDWQANRRHHGGPDQAVYAYALEDLRWWAVELSPAFGRGLHPGQFGENLTTIGVDVTNAVIGERWRIGTATLEVSAPRMPCRTFAGWMGVPRWVKRFSERGACGAYLRVLVEGECRRGDDVVVLSTPGHGVTISQTFRALLGDNGLVEHVLTAPELPAKLAADLRGRLAVAAR